MRRTSAGHRAWSQGRLACLCDLHVLGERPGREHGSHCVGASGGWVTRSNFTVISLRMTPPPPLIIHDLPMNRVPTYKRLRAGAALLSNYCCRIFGHCVVYGGRGQQQLLQGSQGLGTGSSDMRRVSRSMGFWSIRGASQLQRQRCTGAEGVAWARPRARGQLERCLGLARAARRGLWALMASQTPRAARGVCVWCYMRTS